MLAEVAFRCRNAMGITSASGQLTTEWFTFDPDSPSATQLKRLFQLCRDCEDCTFNEATYVVGNGDVELLLCGCCVGAYDEPAGWTARPL